MKKYQTAFAKAVLGSCGWLMGILVLIEGKNLSFTHVAIAAASSAVIATVFAVLYPWIWNDAKLNRFGKVAASAIINITTGCIVIGLVIPAMLTMILPWAPGMLVLSLGLHFVASCFVRETV
ncbi:hypothetical protein JZO70_03890 [Enterococcus sp. 669A]|uniref:Uncharacterized protein n=1 Tax=Candidatus Enterococcus moelleringii TaxID=2815325 RepID=A0ABS3L6P0_9ENTE|nr:hypothetical protein [Enterococcus sp. 669A]MBO1305289.1 hypothetical protein [Enterococcus sp. 669A]